MESLSTLLKEKQSQFEGTVRHKERWLRDGIVILPNVIAFDKKLSPQAKSLLLVLSAHAFLESRFALYEKRNCRVSHDLLKEELGVSSGWISKHSKELMRMGLVEIIRTGRSSYFIVNLSAYEKEVDRVVKHINLIRKKLKCKI